MRRTGWLTVHTHTVHTGDISAPIADNLQDDQANVDIRGDNGLGDVERLNVSSVVDGVFEFHERYEKVFVGDRRS